MSEAQIVGAVATALEPAAAQLGAQLLEDLHSYVSGEITRLEAEMPERMDAAEQAVKYWVGDCKTVLHKFVAKIDEARAGASTKPIIANVGPAATAGSGAVTPPPVVITNAPTAWISGPPVVGPGPHQGIEVPVGQVGIASNPATPVAKPSDAKPSA